MCPVQYRHIVLDIHVAGIRHHGVESARRVKEWLEQLRPDLVLVEGPPEFDAVLKWVAPGQIEPPAAILGYDRQQPKTASFYPFALFSPEWQAIWYANTHGIPVQMIDLPLRYSFEMATPDLPARVPERDPLSYLAEIAGYSDSATWWDATFEIPNRGLTAVQHFETVFMAISALREAGLPSVLEQENVWREAWMRQIIREKQKEMYHHIAVVCGAWHAPVLLRPDQYLASDKALLKQLPKSKINIGATWAPWTNERLGLTGGYGAGIATPGWSEHQWLHPTEIGPQWLAKAARLLRAKNMDISTAHVIEAQHLVQTLAALRQLPGPRLEEYNEAIITVMCMGDAVLFEWIEKTLVTGNVIGSVPAHLPQLPIQADFEAQCKQLRLKPEADSREIKLDLREPSALAKSIFLHQLLALGIEWGVFGQDERAKGTFWEHWTLSWKPELTLDLIAKGGWGNTVDSAATAWTIEQVNAAAALSELTALLERTLPASLWDVMPVLIQRLSDTAAQGNDIADWLRALPPLARAYRYGSVRNTDKSVLRELLDGLIQRTSVGLFYAAKQIDESAANTLLEQIDAAHQAIHFLGTERWTQQWLDGLMLMDEHCHPLIAGYATRLLLDARALTDETAARRFSVALSHGMPTDYSAGWLEGFLKGSGTLLLYDRRLWNILYQWTERLPEEQFIRQLPVLRRTFSRFEPADRRKFGEKARLPVTDAAPVVLPDEEAAFDHVMAQNTMYHIARLLGLPVPVA